MPLMTHLGYTTHSSGFFTQHAKLFTQVAIFLDVFCTLTRFFTFASSSVLWPSHALPWLLTAKSTHRRSLPLLRSTYQHRQTLKSKGCADTKTFTSHSKEPRRRPSGCDTNFPVSRVWIHSLHSENCTKMYYHPFTCSGQPPSPRCYCHTHIVSFINCCWEKPQFRAHTSPPLVLFKRSRIELLRLPLLSISSSSVLCTFAHSVQICCIYVC